VISGKSVEINIEMIIEINNRIYEIFKMMSVYRSMLEKARGKCV
jgi:hypothetical protein